MKEKVLRFLIYFWIFILFSTLIFFFLFYLVINYPINFNGEIIIPENKVSDEIVEILYEKGIVKNKFLIETYIYLLGIEQDFKAGVFDLKDLNTTKDVIFHLLKPPKPKYKKITILEGWNLKEIAEYLKEKGIIKKETEFLKYTGYKDDIKIDSKFEDYLYQRFKILQDKPKGESLEGYLFPDTYFISDNEKVKDIIIRFIDNLSRKISLFLGDIRSQGKSIYEILTMASIIEEEAKFKEDKYLISDILWRRLKKGMLLQVDSSVNYFLETKKRAINFKDIKIKSPYNTYLYPGLPKGPITNPSLESIKAAIYPKKNNYWYFLADKNGKIYYSKTLREHEKRKLELKKKGEF